MFVVCYPTTQKNLELSHTDATLFGAGILNNSVNTTRGKSRFYFLFGFNPICIFMGLYSQINRTQFQNYIKEDSDKTTKSQITA